MGIAQQLRGGKGALGLSGKGKPASSKKAGKDVSKGQKPGKPATAPASSKKPKGKTPARPGAKKKAAPKEPARQPTNLRTRGRELRSKELARKVKSGAPMTPAERQRLRRDKNRQAYNDYMREYRQKRRAEARAAEGQA